MAEKIGPNIPTPNTKPRKEEHKEKHRLFTEKLDKLVLQSKGDSMALAFALVDYLEDWLLDHLITEDQKYVTCFREHGLR